MKLYHFIRNCWKLVLKEKVLENSWHLAQSLHNDGYYCYLKMNWDNCCKVPGDIAINRMDCMAVRGRKMQSCWRVVHMVTITFGVVTNQCAHGCLICKIMEFHMQISAHEVSSWQILVRKVSEDLIHFLDVSKKGNYCALQLRDD